MSTNQNQRAIAAKCLKRLHAESLSLPLVLQDACVDLDEQRRPLVQEFCYGSCRYYPQLAAIVRQRLQKPMRKKDDDVFQLLVIGVYQLLYMRLADHAVVSETVNALKPLGKMWAKGMVNAILRNVLREKDTVITSLKGHEQRAMPAWFDQAIAKQWPEQHEHIAEALASHPPLTIRVNRAHSTPEDYRLQLEQLGIGAKLSRISNDGLILDNPIDVTQLPGFDQGICSVQDEAAQLSAQLVMQDTPNKVLDACAAPGGKTGHILEMGGENIHVTALDNDALRLERVTENLTRLGKQADIQCADANDLETWWDKELYDAILLDAPCSAMGVVRRNPDIKVLRTAKDAHAMPPIQLEILQSLWQTLKPGGLMVYATCSILTPENDAVIRKAVAAIEDIHVEAIDADWGIATEFGRQLMPTIGGNDGFYYACLRKRVATA